MTFNRFAHNSVFVKGMYRSLVEASYKGAKCGTLMFHIVGKNQLLNTQLGFH